MSRLLLVPLLLLVAALAASCGGGEPAAGPPQREAGSSSPEAPGGSPGARPEGPRGETPAATPACEQVRAGIAAFNEGDYEETVARFEAAVPLAEDQVDGSTAADDLLEAVRWYADLPAEEYPEASISSPDFQRYKAITLGQCDPVPDGGGETSPPPVEV